MKLKHIVLGALAVLVVAGSAGWFSLDKETRGLLATLPTNRDVLFWSEPQRDAAFRALDRLPLLAKARDVPAGGTPRPLPPGPPLKLPLDVDAYMAGQRSAALLIAARRQAAPGALRPRTSTPPGAGRASRWPSPSPPRWSVRPCKDGHIRSLDDKVSDYIPEMKGSAYDDVSIRQLLTMTSGVRWNEDYADPNSDVALFNNHQPEPGVDAHGQLHAQAAARGAAGHALALQHRRDQPRGHPASPADQEAAGGLSVGEDLEARRHGAARPPGC